VGARVGVTQNAIAKYIYNHDLHFKTRQKERKRAIGRTIRTNTAWRHNPITSYFDRFPAPNRTVKHWTYMMVADTFTPPTEPTLQHWQ
jgi:hypothetical protein